MNFKLVMIAELSPAKVAIEWDVKEVDCFLVSLKVSFSQELLFAFFTFMILSIFVQNNMVLQVSFLEKGCLTYFALKFLFARVLLHMACHVLGGDRFSADIAFSTLLTLGCRALYLGHIPFNSQYDFVFFLSICTSGRLDYFSVCNIRSEANPTLFLRLLIAFNIDDRGRHSLPIPRLLNLENVDDSLIGSTSLEQEFSRELVEDRDGLGW